MPEIVVARPFILTLDNGEKVPMAIGRHDVDDAVANHWYTKLFLQPEKVMPTDPGLLQSGDAMPLSADVGILSAALATEREITNKLKVELARVTTEMTELFDRAMKAEAALAERGRGGPVDDAATPQAAPATAPALAPTPVPAAPQVLAGEGEGDAADKVVGDYVVRKKGKTFSVLKLNASGVAGETVAEGLTRMDAEAKASELKSA